MKLVLVFFILAVLVVPPSSAQVRGTVELSSVAGSFVPTTQLPLEPIACLAIAGLSCNSSRQQRTSIVFGGRATAWVNRWIALEGTVWYSPNTITDEFSSSQNGVVLGQETREAAANIMAADVRVMVSPVRSRRLWAYVAGGPALVGRFSDAYGLTGNPRLAGVVGAGARLRVARSLAIRAEVAQYHYSVQGYAQRDFLLSLGFSLASQLRIGNAATR
jgi:hypothetical protein